MIKNIYLKELKGFYPIIKILYLVQVILFWGFGILNTIYIITDTTNTIEMIIVHIFISISSIALGIAFFKPMCNYIAEPFHVAPVVARYIHPRKINALLKTETFIYNEDYEDDESKEFLLFSKNWMYVNGYFIPFHAIAAIALAKERHGRRYSHRWSVYYLYITFMNGKSVKIKIREMAKYVGQSEPYFFTDDSFVEYFIKQVTQNTGIIGLNLGFFESLKDYNNLMSPIICHLNTESISIEDINRFNVDREEINILIKNKIKNGEEYITQWTKFCDRADVPYKLLEDSILLSNGSAKEYALCNEKELYEICNKLHIPLDQNKEKDSNFMLKRIYATYKKELLVYKKKRRDDVLWLIFIVIISIIAFCLPFIR